MDELSGESEDEDVIDAETAESGIEKLVKV